MLKCTVKGTSAKIEYSPIYHDVIMEFCKHNLTSYKFQMGRKKGVHPEVDHVYALRTSGAINITRKLVPMLVAALSAKGYHLSVEEDTDFKSVRTVDYETINNITLRDYQRPALDHLNNRSLPGKLVSMQTGSGKTITYLCYLAQVKRLCCGIMKPTYAAQWKKVVPTVLNVDKKRVLYINGAHKLTKLINGEFKGEFDFLLISNKTFQRYVAKLDTGQKTVSVAEIFERLEIGELLIDEVHQDLHFNYSLMALARIESLVGLSATFFNKDKFTVKIQESMFVREDTYDFLADKPYIKYVELGYRFKQGLTPVSSYYGSKAYNHIAYEQWLLKHPKALAGYVKMIGFLAIKTYYSRMEKGDKLLVFSASVDMTNTLQDFLRDLLPDDIIVSAFTAAHEYELLDTLDVISSTPGKVGTAVDIGGLTVVLSGYLTASWQAIVQMLGRVREIPGREVFYIQCVCKDIERQVSYQKDNRHILEDRVAVYLAKHYKHLLGD